MRFLMILGTLAVSPAVALAQADAPPVVLEGLKALRDGHCHDAFDSWTTTWKSGREDTVKRQQLLGSCDMLNQLGGAIRGYDILRTSEISPHLRRVYVLLLYEIQPLYMLLVAYAPDADHWKVTTINWNTDPDKVIPAAVLPPQHPGP